MIYDSKDLWDKFKGSLIKNIEDTKIEILKKAISDKTYRTNSFYKDNLFRKISRDLDLEFYNKEFLRVDAIFCSSKSEWGIPVVFIESENDYENGDVVGSELTKLCFLNAPLKVLFLWTGWHKNKMKEIHDDDFNYFIEDFVEHIKFNGYLAVIVGDVNDNGFRFHSFVYGEEGKIVEGEEKLTDIKL